ncbi:hypothetical protein H4582DRAFT_2053731 [Lactarius indigo]|nr:hypothetical protein H4582DRAFT_2053731 [Lactarius indigo]
MPPRPPTHASSAARTPPTHPSPSSVMPSLNPPIDLGQPMPSAIGEVQSSPRYRFLQQRNSAHEMPPPPVPMHASPSQPSPVNTVGVLASSSASEAGHEALPSPPPPQACRTAFLRRLRATPQLEEPAHMPNVASVPAGPQDASESGIAPMSDQEQVPNTPLADREAAPVREVSEAVAIGATVPHRLQDAAAAELSPALGETQETATPEASHTPRDVLASVAPELAMTAPEPGAMVPKSSQVLGTSCESVAPGPSRVPGEAVALKPSSVSGTLQESVAPEPSPVPGASQESAAPKPSHIHGLSGGAVAPFPSALPKPPVPEPSSVDDPPREAAAPESCEARDTAPSVQADVHNTPPPEADGSGSERRMDTDSIQQGEDSGSDSQSIVHPVMHVARAPYPELHSGRHFTAAYRELMRLDPSDHMGDLIERCTILMGIVFDFHADLSYIRDGLYKHRESDEHRKRS